MVFFLHRDDEDREINHHGRPVEVGEAESSPANGVIKVNLTSSYNRCLVKRYFIVFPLPAQVSEKDLVAVDEKVQLRALTSFYSRWKT